MFSNHSSLPGSENNKTRNRPPVEWVLRIHESGLGASLVAGTWFWLLSEPLPAGLRVLLAAGLMTGVGVLYYFDRRWDLQRSTGKQWSLPTSVAVIGSLASLAVAMGWIAAFLWNSAGRPPIRLAATITTCLLVTVFYYALRLTSPGWQRGRALTVSLIFFAGTAGPSAAWSGEPPSATGLAFFFLLWLNATICLDSGACLAKSTGQAGLWVASMICLGWSNHSLVQLAGSGAAVVLGMILILRWPAAHNFRAAMADAALWAPALLAACFG